ncbi:MAG: hypothetical protein IJY67_02820 [Paludibacteraceae bacterium]|nr:hypothetical protein [Paludibacteraceae bacterium]
MLKRIRQYFFDRAVKHTSRASHYLSWDNIRTVLVLFESDLQEKNQEARDFIKLLQTEGKKVVACCYVDKKKAETATLDNYIVIDRSQVNWLQRPKEEFTQPLKTQFDVVMDMTENDCLPLKYILLQSKSNFRCGKSRVDNELYDFVMEMPPHPVDAKTGMPRMDYNFIGKLGEQIIRYLKMIK